MARGQDSSIANHYTSENLLERIKSGLIAEGKNPETMNANDLKGVDEFHTGGVQATDDLLDQLAVSDDTRVLDIGCGIGGTSRHIASNTGAVVTGFDLTPDYIDTARALSNIVGMSEQTQFHVGSALDIPFADCSFDLATMFHVGMNIADKSALFREAARVLASGGTFAVFDIMKTASGDLTFPFPWAANADCSVVESPDTYKKAAHQAGFEILSERNRRDFTLDYFDKASAAIKKNGAPPAVGIHLLMKETATQKLQNYIAEVKSEKLAPFEMIFRRM